MYEAVMMHYVDFDRKWNNRHIWFFTMYWSWICHSKGKRVLWVQNIFCVMQLNGMHRCVSNSLRPPCPTDNNFIILLYCYLPDLPLASPMTFCSRRSVLVSLGNNFHLNLWQVWALVNLWIFIMRFVNNCHQWNGKSVSDVGDFFPDRPHSNSQINQLGRYLRSFLVWKITFASIWECLENILQHINCILYCISFSKLFSRLIFWLVKYHVYIVNRNS